MGYFASAPQKEYGYRGGILLVVWDGTQEIGALPEPVYLVKAASSMRRLRELCETQSPEPYGKRVRRILNGSQP